MRTLPTVLLLHTTRFGSHHDWLIVAPDRAGEPHPLLWTARVALPSSQWRTAGRWLLTPLPPHRNAYLRHQGPIAGGRGSVRRIDLGEARAELWTASRCVLSVRMMHFQGRIELRRLSPERWEGAVQEAEK